MTTEKFEKEEFDFLTEKINTASQEINKACEAREQVFELLLKKGVMFGEVYEAFCRMSNQMAFVDAGLQSIKMFRDNEVKRKEDVQ